jgi:hypothetical protein
MKTNLNKKRWGRRAVATGVWFVGLNVAFYLCLFRGVELAWWVEYAKYTAFGLVFMVSGLTATDILNNKK